MSDKPIIQQQLSETLSSLVIKVPREGVMEFISTFWETICAEWNGIDRLRYAVGMPISRSLHDCLYEPEYCCVKGLRTIQLILDPLIF